MTRRNTIAGLFATAVVAVAFLFTNAALAGGYDKSSSSAKNASPTQYFIELPHTPSDCLKALDEIKAFGPDKLNQWEWGCMFGNHTGYAIVNARSEAEALNFIPAAEREGAKIFPLTRFTVEEIESFHAMKR